jgi:hypothetical protein
LNHFRRAVEYLRLEIKRKQYRISIIIIREQTSLYNPLLKISFNKDLQPQPSPLLKVVIEEIENKYFSDGQNINSNIILNAIEVELPDLPEINVPELKPKKDRPKGMKNK